MALLYVNGRAIPVDPSEMSVDLQSISASDAGRTEDGVMHTDYVATKRKITMKWPAVEKEMASAIIQPFLPEHISITYYDPYAGATQTRTFYTGDKKMPVLFWFQDTPQGTRKYYSSISVDAIEV